MTTAFDPIDLAGLKLANRIAMAPMTRSRAYGTSPTPQMAEYYAQRASAGLIITEGTQPSLFGQGYPDTPGLHSAEQVRGWRQVTDAVHAAGGRIFAQLMHTGRIGHPVLLPDGGHPVAPSPVKAAGQVYTGAHGMREFVTPRELTEPEITQIIADFAAAARNAVDAGFDGVELHGANGYLINQFIAPNTNLRTDAWGGSIAGRVRFPVEVTRAVADAIGAHRLGLRVSPGGQYNDMSEPDAAEVYPALVEAIAPLGLAYLHVVEYDRELTLRLRAGFPGTLILNPATAPRPTGAPEVDLVAHGVADIVSFGALFLANPDLPARLAKGGPFNDPDPATFYGGDHRGYTDYPTLD